MDLELVLWGYLPIAVALVEITGGILLTFRSKKIFGPVSSFLVLVFNGIAVVILLEMIAGAYPSFIPHFLILISTLYIFFQLFMAKGNRMYKDNLEPYL